VLCGLRWCGVVLCGLRLCGVEFVWCGVEVVLLCVAVVSVV